MTEPITLSAAVIANLAFQEILKSSAGEVTKKFTADAIAKMSELRQKIWARLRGKSQKVDDALKNTEQGDSSALSTIAKNLDVVMDEDAEFASQVQAIAQTINAGKILDQSNMTQNLSDNAKGWQTKVEGGVAYIGEIHQQFTGDPILKYEPPTINSIRGFHNGMQSLVLEDIGNVPVTITKEKHEGINGECDYTIEFEIFNKSRADLKIKAILVEVLSVEPIESIIDYIPLCGLGEARLYSCRVDGRPGIYRSNLLESTFSGYIFLQSGEQETIQIAINTKDEGKYTLRSLLELSSVDGLKTISVGEFNNVRFLKLSR
ncbi:hypothetical protein [Acaryochloris marina]|uniref:Uncharacterized protein n=1 Tax=Acaryochloris marina (strain MBIC 11017) TaxID=329726 RepID=A8ZNF8_ACAM1|nr:hypothetical protein [Acaryochloris marina]ABW32544.1 hypothetical protein AM1_D0047 [Acaryochloris marina MBIC11017]